MERYHLGKLRKRRAELLAMPAWGRREADEYRRLDEFIRRSERLLELIRREENNVYAS